MNLALQQCLEVTGIDSVLDRVKIDLHNIQPDDKVAMLVLQHSQKRLLQQREGLLRQAYGNFKAYFDEEEVQTDGVLTK